MLKNTNNQLINLQYKARHIPLSIALIPVACPQSGNPTEHRVQRGGVGEPTLSNVLDCSTYFNHYLSILHTAHLI